MSRKVIALETTLITQPEPEAPGGSYWILRRTALCDDGTMWEYYGNAWHELEPIPSSEGLEPFASDDFDDFPMSGHDFDGFLP
jgi:hypothetical protein